MGIDKKGLQNTQSSLEARQVCLTICAFTHIYYQPISTIMLYTVASTIINTPYATHHSLLVYYLYTRPSEIK